MPADAVEVPPPPPFEITPELQEQLALLTRQAMEQLAALVAALEAAGAQLTPPPPPETIIPITPAPPPEVVVGDLELSALALEPPILLSGPIEKGEGWDWSRPMPLAVEMARMVPVDLPVIAIEPAAPQPAGFAPAEGGFAPAEVVDLSRFWLDDTRHGGEAGMF